MIYIQELHRRGNVDFGRGLDGKPERCLEDSYGSEIVSDLKPDSDDFIVIKRRFSGYLFNLFYIPRKDGSIFFYRCQSHLPARLDFLKKRFARTGSLPEKKEIAAAASNKLKNR